MNPLSEAHRFIQEFNAERRAGVYNFSKDGHCSGCGACCSDILPMSLPEVNRIRKWVAQHKYVPNTQILPMMTATYDMTCPFLNKQKKCDIYEIRPAVCKLFHCWKKQMSDYAKEGKMPPADEMREHVKWAESNPVPMSVRQEIFGQEVPF